MKPLHRGPVCEVSGFKGLDKAMRQFSYHRLQGIPRATVSYDCSCGARIRMQVGELRSGSRNDGDH